jgi:signal transduction histidine kinase
MARNWLIRHPRIVDVALFLAALAFSVGHASAHEQPWVGIPLAFVECAPLLVRRRYPLAVLGVTLAATVAVTLAWDWYNPFPAAGIALLTVAIECDRRTSLRALAATLAVVFIPFWYSVGWTNGLALAGRLLGFGIAWLIGDSIAARRREVETAEERARTDEQARIARELHDVIAHNVSVMVVQAAAANDVFDSRPDRAREALQAIEASGRKALGELRSLLGSVSDGADYAPQPGLDRLDELIGQVRTAGLAVAVSIDGTPRELPAGIDLSAYRVVQEALTNTLKHAHATRADVGLRYGDHELGVTVRDDGSGGGNGGGSGRGLVGMRERLAAFGGSLEAGPAPAGGYAVEARFPL